MPIRPTTVLPRRRVANPSHNGSPQTTEDILTYYSETWQGFGWPFVEVDCPKPDGGDVHEASPWYAIWTPHPAMEKCRCGDLNGDGGAVGLSDFSLFQVCFGLGWPTEQCPLALLDCADLNQDGWVNLTDFNTFQVLFGTVSTSAPPNCGQ